VPVVRVLPFETAPGPFNMAADEALLESAQNGQASLRLYQWSEATVSLGYFQPATARLDQGLGALPFVRRPSGGGTLVHHHELTYCLALPLTDPFASVEKWMPRMHGIIVAALDGMGVSDGIELVESETQRFGPILCFQHYTPGDILCAGKKIVGSAQRKQRMCLMQHGGILLTQSETTPELPGLLELTRKGIEPGDLAERILTVFAKDTGWELVPAHWTAGEQATIQWLVENRYGASAWNEKR